MGKAEMFQHRQANSDPKKTSLDIFFNFIFAIDLFILACGCCCAADPGHYLLN